MRKLIGGALAAMFVVTTIPTVASAAPRYTHRDREHFVSQYCSQHPRDRDCRDWHSHGTRWDDARYHRWYRDHHDDFGPADAAAAIFGFAASVAGAAANAASDAGHVAACEARYRSYNSHTDMYLGYDGRHHYCRL